MREEIAVSRRDVLKTAGAVATGVTATSLIPALEAAAASYR